MAEKKTGRAAVRKTHFKEMLFVVVPRRLCLYAFVSKEENGIKNKVREGG